MKRPPLYKDGQACLVQLAGGRVNATVKGHDEKRDLVTITYIDGEGDPVWKRVPAGAVILAHLST